MSELRPYQQDAIARVRHAWTTGARRVVLCMPTGAGKTVTAGEMVRRANANGRKALWLAHRSELVDQACDTLTRMGLTVGAVCATATTPPNPFAPVQVASVQTLLARNLRPDADLIVTDECVPSNTMVGGREACSLAVGDYVESWDGTKIVRRRIVRVFVRRPRSMLTLRVGDRSVSCTGSHPIWIEGRGYVEARNVSVGDLCRVRIADAEIRARQHADDLLEDVPAAFARVGTRTARSASSGAAIGAHAGARATTRSRMRGLRFVDALAGTEARMEAGLLGDVRERDPLPHDGGNKSQARERADEDAKPDAAPRNAGSRLAGLTGHGPSSTVDRRKRPRDDEAAGDPARGTRPRMATGVLDLHEAHARTPLFDRDRPGESFREDRSRDRRLIAQHESLAGTRCEEDGVSRLARVDRVEVHEPGSDGTFGGVCPDGLVYNFEVEGEHNFFANGVLTHNCHHFAAAAEQWAALLADYPKAYVVGPTATPERGDGCGLRGCFDAIVVGATVRQLTNDGHLVPCEIFRPDKPLEPGKIAQNPVDAYVEHAAGRRAVVFARSVALAESYAGEFTMRGIAARTISAETPWAERKLYLDAFKRGAVRVLVNVYVLTEGFDDPGVSCCILARGCGSAGMYLQMIGRILRPADGKRDAVLLDLRGVSHEHGRPEDDREFSLDGAGIRLRDANSYCPVCGAPRTPPEPCAACGYAPSGEDASKPDVVTGEKLKPYLKFRETDDEAKRVERLSRWIIAGRVKGFKPGWAKAKYNAVYGGWPSASILGAAVEMANAKGAA